MFALRSGIASHWAQLILDDLVEIGVDQLNSFLSLARRGPTGLDRSAVMERKKKKNRKEDLRTEMHFLEGNNPARRNLIV